MLSQFLANNREDLIRRCIDKVAKRPKRAATKEQLQNGVPRFLDQLRRTLVLEEGPRGTGKEDFSISGASGGDGAALSEMGTTAAAHGRELLTLGFTVDQVVHDYGDLCQAITDLAVERDAPFSVDEFRTLNRCLDNAIADAVTEFSAQRDALLVRQRNSEATERIGYLAHELRNALGTATLAASAMEMGSMAMSGATGGVLKRSHAAMSLLITRALAEVREATGKGDVAQVFPVAELIRDAEVAGALDAQARQCGLKAAAVDPKLEIIADRPLLQAALSNLLQNAFKFSQPNTTVLLSARAEESYVLIDVQDHCGGLPRGGAEQMFTPFTQRSADKSGLGLGLSIARHTVEAEGGTLSVRDLPGTGCVFTIRLPRHGTPVVLDRRAPKAP
jgi:signal transduction histidine kinase